MKPTLSSNWKRVSIFVYENTTTSPRAVMLNRRWTSASNMFFSGLIITGSANRAGTAKFSAIALNDASIEHKKLFDDTLFLVDTPITQKYVVIIAGEDVIWSGKILRSVSRAQPLFSTTVNYTIWDVECESDISKMKLQALPTSAMGKQTGKIGEIVSKVVSNQSSTDINWTGLISGSSPAIYDGIISNEGAECSVTILDGDMYSQFISLAKMSGFEWRTRLVTWFGQYTTWNGSTTLVGYDITTIYPAASLLNKWVIFIGSSNSTDYVTSYGRISSVTGGTIVLKEVVNPTLPPATSGLFVIIMNPVIDIAWDLAQPTPVQTICVNAPDDGLASVCYNFNDKTDKKLLATKVTARAKNIDTSLSKTGAPESISSTLYAINRWDKSATMFDNTSVVTQKMDGYIDTYVGGSTYLYLQGRGYALQINDVVDILMRNSGTVPNSLIIDKTITSVANDTSDDYGTRTIIGFAGSLQAEDGLKYGILNARKTYVQDTTRLFGSLSVPTTIYFGDDSNMNKSVTSSGLDPTYGYWVYGITNAGNPLKWRFPIMPGCLAYNSTHSVSGPNATSPLGLSGIISISETVDQAITQGDIEQYATQSLINHSFYLRKASFTTFITSFLKPSDRNTNEWYGWKLIREGDKIAIKTNDGDDLTELAFDGQPKFQWEVMSWTLDCDKMTIDVLVGDFEQNVFTLLSIKTSALDQTIT
jgi:hypothetical protein